ncbi:MAG: hypothetical protein K0R03_805 [Moraxellaceae bacterium]|jgi:uncharacterized protein (TIGR03118 family)|nr:hypothetical protein [Moraxellaceae bacterium]
MHINYNSLRACTLAFSLCTLAACNGGSSSDGNTAGQTPGGVSQQTQGFNVTVLVTSPQSIVDTGTTGTGITDGNLSKPWGLTVGDGPVRVANAHTNVATVYDANGLSQGGAIPIPGSRGGSHVTGVVSGAGATAFQVSANGVTGPATYLFSTSSGTLAAWSAGSGFGNAAATVYTDPSGSAEYTGLALLASGGSQFLYAVDFQNGRIDTFDTSFNKITTRGDFRDPNLPAGYKPFNIQTLGNRLAVVYAKPRVVNGVPAIVSGAGTGIVDLFDASGNLVQRLITGGQLNAPRGIALAPDNFGELSGRVLVANSGDGRINAFDRNTGAFVGSMNDASGTAITIPGISALAFRNGDRIGSTGGATVGSISDNTLFFTAGTENSLQSAFGRIQPAPRQ